MTKLRCCFCQQELERNDLDVQMFGCENQNCEHSIHARTEYAATKAIWQELIRTRKALDVAKNAINSAADHNIINCVARGIDPRTDDTSVTLCNALEQITALEQKD